MSKVTDGWPRPYSVELPGGVVQLPSHLLLCPRGYLSHDDHSLQSRPIPWVVGDAVLVLTRYIRGQYFQYGGGWTDYQIHAVAGKVVGVDADELAVLKAMLDAIGLARERIAVAKVNMLVPK